MASVTTLFEQSTHSDFSQLPIDWYLNPEVYALEINHLFSQSPKYVGHELMAPNAGDFLTLSWLNDAKALVNQNGNVNLISNVCRHRQAIMLTGKGHTNHIVCPLHRWTYDLSGKLLGAPHFKQNPCLHLDQLSLLTWQGLLFDISQKPHNIAQELSALGCKQDFDFTGYQFDHVEIEHYNFNWKTFIEVYLEDYHVGPFHPGLNQFVNCDELKWQFGENHSVQTVGYKPSPDMHLSPVYKNWQDSVSNYHQNQHPKHGAIWFVYYPFLMIEWYPNVLVVSHIIPTGVESCSNVVEFYYPEDIALFEREYIKAQQAAYNETAIEDKEICQRMHDGRKALYLQGLDERGPYQHPMETGLEHFHLWYRKQLAPYLTDKQR
jgi:phenylpropionate dioxygenase-like ring-hydroxylating dioxygenase large terminal subunit